MRRVAGGWREAFLGGGGQMKVGWEKDSAGKGMGLVALSSAKSYPPFKLDTELLCDYEIDGTDT